MVHTQGEAPAMTASLQVEANKSPTRLPLMGGIAPKMVGSRTTCCMAMCGNVLSFQNGIGAWRPSAR